MHDKFDELTKSLAQSVTRRGALKKFGVGLAAMGMTAVGLTNAHADPKPKFLCDCSDPYFGCGRYANSPGKYHACLDYCSGCLQP